MPLDSAEKRAVEKRELAELQRVLREHEARAASGLRVRQDHQLAFGVNVEADRPR
jgi:CHAT domain-containing protein